MLKDKKFVSWRILRSDLARWLQDPFPVILIVYDARNESAYWLFVQRYFEQIAGFNLFAAPATLSIKIPVENVLDRSAILLFSSFRDQMLQEMRGGIHEKI